MRGLTWSVAIVGGLCLGALSIPPGAWAAGQEDTRAIFRAARAYTVRIRTQITTPFIEDVQCSAEGAGFLVDAGRGWVVTNAHVVGQSPSTVQVAFVDGVFRPARKVYVDSFTDVAVLEVQADQRRHAVAPVECDRVPEVGEGVGAFGHPLGLTFTGTRGIVSGKTDQLGNDLLQIDATVDHGNSGGPVISLRDGKIVGIATAGAGGPNSDRINFATPMMDVCRILDLLRRGLPAEPPRMEFSLLVDADQRYTLEVGCTYNAARWPFLPGDRIVAVGSDGDPVGTRSQLVTALRGRRGAVPIRVARGDREVEVLATPAWRPSVTARGAAWIDGALVAPMAVEDSVALRDPAGLVVQSVEPGSRADAVGLEKLDIIENVDGRRFEDVDSLIAHLQAREPGSPVRIVYRRTAMSEDRWFDFHVRELPGEDVRIIGPEGQLVDGGR